MRRIEEQFYWEDYWERNAVDTEDGGMGDSSVPF
jgi:hypothetical protein